MPNAKYNLAHLAQMENPSVVMMVGVPGSGKSYIAEQLSELLAIDVLSSDECRKELTGDANDQSMSREAWDLVRQRAQDAIADGRSIVIDGTHNNREGRRRDIAQYRSFGAKAVIGVNIVASLETAKTRNTSRERVVPEFVIEHMQQNIDSAPPSTDDGFDFVVTCINN